MKKRLQTDSGKSQKETSSKQVTAAEGKAQSVKRSLTGKQIEERQRSSFRHKECDKVLSAITDRLTGNILEGADACGGSERSVDLKIRRPKRVSGSKGSMTVSLRVTDLGTISRRWWKTLSRGRTKQYPLWSRETRMCRNGMSRRCLRRGLFTVALPGFSGGKLSGRSTKKSQK